MYVHTYIRVCVNYSFEFNIYICMYLKIFKNFLCERRYCEGLKNYKRAERKEINVCPFQLNFRHSKQTSRYINVKEHLNKNALWF